MQHARQFCDPVDEKFWEWKQREIEIVQETRNNLIAHKHRGQFLVEFYQRASAFRYESTYKETS